MDLKKLIQESEFEWRIAPIGKMRVPAVLYGSADLMRDMDEKVYEQIVNVATLPGIEKAAYTMPDAHWGYGFPFGGVAAFNPREGGVGFDISCGVRTLTTGLTIEEVRPVAAELADALYRTVPAGVGSRGRIHLDPVAMEGMLTNGAAWAVERGYGMREDLDRIEERGSMRGAQPEAVSDFAKKRQKDEMGTPGSGNHYLEVQCVAAIYNSNIANAFGIHENEVVLSIHCGSRGLGH